MDFEDLQDKIIISFLKHSTLILILATVLAFYYYCTSTYDFFKKKGVPYKRPVIFFGNTWSRISNKQSMPEYQIDLYNYFKGKRYGGVFMGRIPFLYVFDPELVKVVMIRDFDHFTDRNSVKLNAGRYFDRRLDTLKGSEWKEVRSALTPAFSSAKLKTMIPLLELCAQQMVDYIKVHDQKELELRTAMGRYTLEVIGACAFGVKLDTLKDEHNHFVKMAEKYEDVSKFKKLLAFLILTFLPSFLNFTKLNFFNMTAIEELLKMLQVAKKERRSKNSKEKDFLQILVDMAKEDQSGSNDTGAKYIIDEDTIDGQCILFLLGGYDTSSALLSFVLHVLAIKPELQEKLRGHILEKTEGKKLTYEVLQELDFLEAVILETLRMYPPIPRIDRVVTKPYKFPGSEVQLDVGDIIVFPIYGIQMDPDYYPEPHEFRPERFMGEEKKARPSHLFLGFGAGQRNCMGQRFTLFTTKMSLVHLMKNYKFTKCSKTQETIAFDPQGMILKAKAGLWVRVNKL